MASTRAAGCALLMAVLLQVASAQFFGGGATPSPSPPPTKTTVKAPVKAPATTSATPGVAPAPVAMDGTTYWGATAKSNVTGAQVTLFFSEANSTMSGTVNIKRIDGLTLARLVIGNVSATSKKYAFWVWSTDLKRQASQPLTGSFSFPWYAEADNLLKPSRLASYAEFLTQLSTGQVYLSVQTSSGELIAPVIPKRAPKPPKRMTRKVSRRSLA